MNDPISDLLTQIKNAYMARKETVVISHSKPKEMIALLLSKEGYVGKVSVKETEGKKKITIEMLYREKKPKVTDLTRISKPGRRVYAAKDSLPKVLGGLGITIVSTSSGLMTDREARKKGLGGELICKVW